MRLRQVRSRSYPDRREHWLNEHPCERTGIINEIRAFLLERGVAAVRQGLRFLRTELPGILATRSSVLSPRMLRLVGDLAGDWRHLDARVEGLSDEIETLARQDQHCVRLMTVPGIGPIISSAMVAAIGTGDLFSKGRDFGDWLGLVPKQIPTGDRDNSRQHIKARQSLSAHSVQSGGLGCAGQARAKALGALWAQISDRGGEESTALQRARYCAAQQARPHRLGGSQQGARLCVHQDRCGGIPSSVILAPCSRPSRAAWQHGSEGQGQHNGHP
jgi:hypothetical protein